MTDVITFTLKYLAALCGLGTLMVSIYNMLRAQRNPSGQQTGAAGKLLRIPVLIIATLIFIFIAYLLWLPLPFHLDDPLKLIMSLLGSFIFFPGLALYLWGLRTLGQNFNASSGFGVRLHETHRLITNGPYAYIRHPMYLAVILAFWGAALIYRTWAMLVYAIIMFGLIYRARKEEEALNLAFGDEWSAYQARVPAWLPRIHF